MQSLCEREGWQLKLRLSDFRGWGQLIQPLCKSSRIGLPSQILLAYWLSRGRVIEYQRIHKDQV